MLAKRLSEQMNSKGQGQQRPSSHAEAVDKNQNLMGITGVLSSGHGISGMNKINFANQHLNQPVFKNSISK